MWQDFLRKYNLLIGFYGDRTIGTLTLNIPSYFKQEQEAEIELLETPILRPMGISVVESGIWLVSSQGISWFSKLALEEETIFYRFHHSRYLGQIQVHELVTVNEIPIFANTLFNCLAMPSRDRDWALVWQPNFIKEIVPQDRAHLNGIALDSHGSIVYISCFAPQNVARQKSWRDFPGGCVWDVNSQMAVIEDIALPHSPRLIDERLIVCESGKGRLLIREGDNLYASNYLGSFTRGLIAIDDYIIVGTSQVRLPLTTENKHNLQLDLSLLQDNRCGVHLLKRDTLEHLDSYFFADKREIFDLQAIPKNSYLITSETKLKEPIHLQKND